MHEIPFSEKSVVITGASLGIGRAMALQLSGQGAWLTLAARHREELDQAAEACRERGGRCIAIPTDVSNETACTHLIDGAIAEYGRIDVLIVNAGIGMVAKFDELPSLSVMKTVMDVNFWGCLYCIYHALPQLKASKGRIVVVSSGGGKMPTPNAIGYGAAKWALAGFSDTLRIELAASGISVTVSYPEWVATGISSRAPRADGTPLGEIVSHEMGAMSAEECARRILNGAAARKRDGMSARLRLGIMLAPILPHLIDAIAAREYA